jgi:membrane protease YdiL (CAAX protease family)
MSTDFSEQPPALPPGHVLLPDEVLGSQSWPPPSSLPPKHGHPLLAWIVITLAVVVAVGLQMLGARFQTEKERAHLWTIQLQGRATVGTVQHLGQSPGVAYQQIQNELHRGTPAERLRYIVLAGELAGPGEALKQLGELRDSWDGHPPSGDDARAAELLDSLYRDYDAGKWDAPSLSEDERDELRKELGWFGELALAPAQGPDMAARAAVLREARRTFYVEMGAGLGFFLLAGLGLLVLVVGIAVVWVGLVRPHFAAGSRYGGVYAETFALWIVLYLLLGAGAKLVPNWRPPLLVSGLIGLLSLAVLAWPVLRGVPWQRVLQDLGWWAPRDAVLDPLWGVACWVAALPLAFLGGLASQLVLNWYRRTAGDDLFGVPLNPAHPATEWLAYGGTWERVQVILLATVFAPLLEETMFRGVLYRHLREVGAKWPRVASFLFSALGASFIFAVIHPQGLLGVPALMALALGFSMARELRGSLLGPMTAHALNNGLVTLLLLLMT